VRSRYPKLKSILSSQVSPALTLKGCAERAFAHTLNLTSSEAWTEFCANGQRPSDIPSNPQATYHRDWSGWRDWLGTGRTRNARSERYSFRSFEEARLFARNLGLSSRAEWRSYCASAERPIDIPTNPNIAYRSMWKDWDDWLGTGNTKNSFLPFEEARPIAQGLRLASQAEYYAAGRRACSRLDCPKTRVPRIFSLAGEVGATGSAVHVKAPSKKGKRGDPFPNW
jgi:hypothetical protein